jgi:hypothetical protein
MAMGAFDMGAVSVACCEAAGEFLMAGQSGGTPEFDVLCAEPGCAAGMYICICIYRCMYVCTHTQNPMYLCIYDN